MSGVSVRSFGCIAGRHEPCTGEHCECPCHAPKPVAAEAITVQGPGGPIHVIGEEKDERIRQLELENAALALELRRATKARGR